MEAIKRKQTELRCGVFFNKTVAIEYNCKLLSHAIAITHTTRILPRIFRVVFCCTWYEFARVKLEKISGKLFKLWLLWQRGWTEVNFNDTVILRRLENLVICEDSRLYKFS